MGYFSDGVKHFSEGNEEEKKSNHVIETQEEDDDIFEELMSEGSSSGDDDFESELEGEFMQGDEEPEFYEEEFDEPVYDTPVKEESKPTEKEEPAKVEEPVKEIKKEFEPVPVSVVNKAPLTGLTIHVDDGEVGISGGGSGVVFVGNGCLKVLNDGKLENCSYHTNSVSVFGRVDGDIAGEELERVILKSGGKVVGNICADQIEIESGIVIGGLFGSSVKIKDGAVKGNVVAKEDVQINGSSKIKGDVESGHLDIDKGVLISGKCIQYGTGVDIPDDVFE